MELYYTPRCNVTEKYLRITGEELHHVKNVMRHKIGDVIYVTDGEGIEYQAEITKIASQYLEAKILNKNYAPREPKVKITLAQCIIKGPRMDFVVEKATELGIYELIPVSSERTVAALTSNKLRRYQNIAISAMKSSLRTSLPRIQKLFSLKDVIGSASNYDLALMGWEEEKDTHLFNISKSNFNSLLLIIGPEGGFSSKEVLWAKENNILLFSLGARRLRAETAAIAALSVLLFKVQDL
jgi:16S rRNA (uracil1498-N3)-methyltransferase